MTTEEIMEKNKETKDPSEEYLPPRKIGNRDHIVQVIAVKFKDLKGTISTDQTRTFPATSISPRKLACNENWGILTSIKQYYHHKNVSLWHTNKYRIEKHGPTIGYKDSLLVQLQTITAHIMYTFQQQEEEEEQILLHFPQYMYRYQNNHLKIN